MAIIDYFYTQTQVLSSDMPVMLGTTCYDCDVDVKLHTNLYYIDALYKRGRHSRVKSFMRTTPAGAAMILLRLRSSGHRIPDRVFANIIKYAHDTIALCELANILGSEFTAKLQEEGGA